MCVIPRPMGVEDIPQSYTGDKWWCHHDWTQEGCSDATSGGNPWKIHVHEHDHWATYEELCARAAPLPYIGRDIGWGCIIAKSEIPGVSDDASMNTWLSEREFAKTENYVDGSMTHTWDATSNDYMISSGAHKEGWNYPPQYQRSLPMQEEEEEDMSFTMGGPI